MMMQPDAQTKEYLEGIVAAGLGKLGTMRYDINAQFSRQFQFSEEQTDKVLHELIKKGFIFKVGDLYKLL